MEMKRFSRRHGVFNYRTSRGVSHGNVRVWLQVIARLATTTDVPPYLTAWARKVDAWRIEW